MPSLANRDPRRSQPPCGIGARTEWPVLGILAARTATVPLIGKVEPGERLPAAWNQTFIF
jgi:hypothetical protein